MTMMAIPVRGEKIMKIKQDKKLIIIDVSILISFLRFLLTFPVSHQ